MEIHFCDLCNESVPQSDLDAGRAFLRKGRVVCQRCDALMSAAAAAGADAAGPFGGSSPAVVAAVPVAAAAVAATAAATPPWPALPAARPRGGAAGVILGLLALAGVGAAIYWTRGELARGDRGMDDLRAELDGLVSGLRREVDRGREEQTAGESRIEAAFAARLDEQRLALEKNLQAGSETSASAHAKLDELSRRLDELKAGLGAVQRHDSDLRRIREGAVKTEADVAALARALEELEREREAAAAAEPAPAATAAPAWLGLVKDLSSPEAGIRWQAVCALGETKDPAVVEYLLPSLKDADTFVRMATARKLGDLGSLGAVGALIEGLEDAEGAVRQSMYDALKKITKKDFPFDGEHPDAAERARKIKVWREWWEREKDKATG